MPAAGGGTKMTDKSATLPARLLRYLGYIVRLAVLAGIYALVLFYLNATAADLDIPPIPTKITIALIALGITGSIYEILVRIAVEVIGGIVVIADFLKTHLLEPRERRLRAEGFDEGRAEGREEGRAEGIDEGRVIGIDEGRVIGIDEGRVLGIDEGRAEIRAEWEADREHIRSRLLANGIDLDRIIADDSDDDNARRC